MLGGSEVAQAAISTFEWQRASYLPLAWIIHDQCEIEDSALNVQIALHNSPLLRHQILSLLFASWILDSSDPNTVSVNTHKIGGQTKSTSHNSIDFKPVPIMSHNRMTHREQCTGCQQPSHVHTSRFCVIRSLKRGRTYDFIFYTNSLQTLSLQQQEEIAAIRGSLANCKSMSATDERDCKLFSAHCGQILHTVHSAQCTVDNAQCSVHNAHCITMHNVCTVHNAHR